MPETNPTASTETVNHTAIELAAGLMLVVHEDFVDDPSTTVLVDNLREHIDRGNRERELRKHVETFRAAGADNADVQHIACDALGDILEAMGWCDNFTGRSSDELADTVSALIPLATPISLIHACQVAANEFREMATALYEFALAKAVRS